MWVECGLTEVEIGAMKESDEIIAYVIGPECQFHEINTWLAMEWAGMKPSPLLFHRSKKDFPHIEFTTPEWQQWVRKQYLSIDNRRI